MMIKHIFSTVIIILFNFTLNYGQNIYIQDAYFEESEILEGETTDLVIVLSFEDISTVIPSGSLNIQFSFPYNHYTTSIYNTPDEDGASIFNWSLDENNFWNGINQSPILAYRDYIIRVEAIGISETEKPETTDIIIRPILDLDLFQSDDPLDNYIQASLSIIENTRLLSYTNLSPEKNENEVSVDTDLNITFSEDIQIDQGTIQIRECETDVLIRQFNSNHPSLSTNADLLNIELEQLNFETCYYVLITPSMLKSSAYNKDFIGIHDPMEWRFITGDYCSSQPESNPNICNNDLVLTGNRNLDNTEQRDDALSIHSEQVVDGSGSLTYNAPYNVRLNSGFRLYENTKFKAQIGECEESNSSFNVQVFLQGALYTGSKFIGEYSDLMKTELVNSLVLPNSTLSGNPYANDPWDYSLCIPTNPFAEGFDSNVTDWVLLELRSGTSANTTICQKVGLLYSDGSIEIPDGGICDVFEGDEVYIVVKHRNHIPIISPPVTIDGNKQASFDFRINNSIQGRETIGQILLPDGRYAMAAGNCEQSEAIFSEYSIQNLDVIFVNSFAFSRPLIDKGIGGIVVDGGVVGGVVGDGGEDTIRDRIPFYNNADLDLNSFVDLNDYQLLNLNLNLIGTLVE